MSAMSIPSLPLELLDRIIDLLYDSHTTLRDCCLVAKSWVPRTRSHLFDKVILSIEELRTWKEIFPDPSTSPARYAKTLIIACIPVTAAEGEVGGWIRGFSYVERLEVTAHLSGSRATVPLLPFCGFSPILKSLSVYFYFDPSSEIFDLILSFPLLEDLHVTIGDNGLINNNNGFSQPSTVIQSPNQPMTGFLDLSQCGRLGFIAGWLLSLSGGLHFCKLAVKCSRPADISLITMLVEECSHTLEYIEIYCIFCVSWGQCSIDLSKATRLKDLDFRFGSQDVGITTVLRTIKAEHRDFRQITIYLPDDHLLSDPRDGANIRQTLGELISGQWLELDHLLTQLWESHSIRPKVLYYAPMGTGIRITKHLGCLLPEITGRGIIDLVKRI